MAGCRAAVDMTLVEKATGRDVVETVCYRILKSCIFDDDKFLLRRIAYTETKDGTDPQTDDMYGGIWQVC